MICFDIMDRRLCLPVLCLLCAFQQTVYAQRTETLLESGWKFHRGEAGNAQEAVYDDSSWEDVCIPHDWAIYGPFDVNNDLQTVRVTQDYETKASVRTGRTGGLPYMGVGWYRRTFDVPEGKRAVLLFDGAMSEAKVYVNGEEVCFWPYGYSPSGEPSAVFQMVSGSRSLPQCASDNGRSGTCTGLGYKGDDSARGQYLCISAYRDACRES